MNKAFIRNWDSNTVIALKYPEIDSCTFGFAQAWHDNKLRRVRFYRSCTGLIQVFDLKSGMKTYKTNEEITITIP